MHLCLQLRPCRAGDCLPLLPAGRPGEGVWPAHCLAEPVPRPLPPLPVGSCLHDAEGKAWLKVVGRAWLPSAAGPADAHACDCPLVTALTDIAPDATPERGALELKIRKQGHALAWITLSDKGSQGLREDLSGPAIRELTAARLPLCHSQGFLLPDEPAQLRALLTDLALHQGYDLICTTGGTGLSPRDTTPQVTAALLDTPLPGFSQAMMAASLAQTPHAAISRAVAGVLGQSIIINLPGSRKGALENLAAVLPALPHALDKLHGDPADCGG
ncbi:MogA/MoaB family molybdenum cofactor biosynthesis protein [uncultured Desulfovibrio sp.]|uniref:MogA/MoaB family molybdenum cofactor biosynthesis protein n=1 Tax=uncultured Desulfovibrio sp. TaxID=167968 RepID=UPI0026269DCD|nr:MogA/MoaB family molybdenum cofactor biosynthesis protein [uncultured Desulfovibrio sp.]